MCIWNIIRIYGIYIIPRFVILFPVTITVYLRLGKEIYLAQFLRLKIQDQVVSLGLILVRVLLSASQNGGGVEREIAMCRSEQSDGETGESGIGLIFYNNSSEN